MSRLKNKLIIIKINNNNCQQSELFSSFGAGSSPSRKRKSDCLRVYFQTHPDSDKVDMKALGKVLLYLLSQLSHEAMKKGGTFSLFLSNCNSLKVQY